MLTFDKEALHFEAETYINLDEFQRQDIHQRAMLLDPILNEIKQNLCRQLGIDNYGESFL